MAATVWPTNERLAASAAIEADGRTEASGAGLIGGAVGQADGELSRWLAGGEQHRPVHGVLQLAHVAGQRWSTSGGGRPATAGAPERPFGGGVLLHEVLGQGEESPGTLAQRRQAQIDDVEAVQQVFAERAVLDRLGQVAVAGGQDADVDAHRLGAADAVDLAFLNGAQQLGLQPASISLISSSSSVPPSASRTCRCGGRRRR
jgi:hypothetical protein